MNVVKKINDFIKDDTQDGGLKQLMSGYLKKRAGSTTKQIVSEKLDVLHKKGGKSPEQALTYGKVIAYILTPKAKPWGALPYIW